MKKTYLKKKWLAMVFIILIGLCAGCSNEPNSENLQTEIKNLVGTKYIYPQSMDIIKEYGSPETLSGTNNSRWVAYFPKGNFTIINDKKTDIIKKVLAGKKPQ